VTPSESAPSGRDLYSGRSYSAPEPGTNINPNDSAQVPAAPAGAGETTAGPADAIVPSSRSASRVRFPAPYSPAGSIRRDGTAGSSPRGDIVPRSATPDSSARTSFPASRSQPGTSSGSVHSPGRKTVSGPAVGYDRGPTRRFDVPKTVTGSRGALQPDSPKSGKSGGLTPTKPKGKTVAAPGKSLGWREVKRQKPEAARQITGATRIAGRVNDLAVGVAVGAVGGVHPGTYHGGSDSWHCDPWGCDNWSVSFCWGWGCWSWPCYWACYYPYWWYCSGPYYASAYWYYPVVASTVYVETEPQVVYAEPQPTAAPAVGEGAVLANQQEGPAGVPLTIAAQRYLELGDRAFREGRYTDAVQFYAKAVEFAPDQGALYLVLADALFAAGDYHYGAYAIRRALELDPSLVQTTVDKHGFYPDPSLFEQQLTALERYLSEHSADRDARLVLALNYLFAARAIDATRVLEASPGDDPAAARILEEARARAR